MLGVPSTVEKQVEQLLNILVYCGYRFPEDTLLQNGRENDSDVRGTLRHDLQPDARRLYHRPARTAPVEEFYDVEQDPYEVNNLAEDPQYAGKLAELRAALQEWAKMYGDMGAIPEVITESGGVRISCTARGASIGYYITRKGESPSPGTHRVRSWDVEFLLGVAKPGDERPAPEVWNVYDGEVIPYQDIPSVDVLLTEKAPKSHPILTTCSPTDGTLSSIRPSGGGLR